MTPARMRIGLLSDVHGNLAGLRAVADALGREGPLDAVVVAGDHLWGGPRPREVWETLVGEARVDEGVPATAGAERAHTGEEPVRLLERLAAEDAHAIARVGRIQPRAVPAPTTRGCRRR